jgi:HEAT repeat protein
MMFGNDFKKIEKLASKKNSEALAKFLTNKDLQVRIAAIKGLGESGGETSFNHLTPSLRDSNPSIRAAAATALRALNDPRAVAFISNGLKSETDPVTKEAMSRALGAFSDTY